MGNVNDIRGMSKQVESARIDLDAAHDRGDVDPDDYDAIISTYDNCAGDDWESESTKRTRLRDLRTAAETTTKPLTAYEDIDDVNELLQALADAGAKAASTQRGYTAALTHFYEHIDDHDTKWGEHPFYENITPNADGTSGTDKIDATNILKWPEVLALREHAGTPRDATIIMFLADTGLRIGAACALRVGDVKGLDTEAPTFKPNPNAIGQKGILDHDMGEFPIFDSKVDLRQWINQHHPEAPNPHPDAPLWPVSRGYDRDDRENCALTPRTIKYHVDKAADAAGIDKSVNLHAFRHACVKHLKQEYDYDWTELRDTLAWSDGAVSEMAQRYGKLDGEERRERLQTKRGVTTPDEEPTPEPEPCPNCRTEIPVGVNHCPQCGINPDARTEQTASVEDLKAEMEELKATMNERLFKSLDAEDADTASSKIQNTVPDDDA